MDDKIDQADVSKGVHADNVENQPQYADPNAPRVMSPERRVAVEKSMKRKLDARCSLFVLIYIMSTVHCKSFTMSFEKYSYFELQTTSTETTLLLPVSAVFRMI